MSSESPSISSGERAPGEVLQEVKRRGRRIQARRRALAGLGGLGAAGAVVAVALLLVGGPAPAPVQVVSTAAAQTSAAGSARLAIATSQGGQEDTSTAASGVFDFARHVGELTTVEPSGPASDVSSSGSGPDGTGIVVPSSPGTPAAPTTTQTIFDGGTIYRTLSAFSLPGLRASTPPSLVGKKWVSETLPIPTGAATSPAARAFNALDGFLGLLPASIDPGDDLDALRSIASKATSAGSDVIRQVPTTHYVVTLDPDRALALMPSKMTTKQRQQFREFIDGFGGKTHTVDLWVDAQGRARRLRVRYQYPAGTSGQAVSVVTTQIDYWDFGVAVDVADPPSEQVVTQQELMQALCEAAVNSPLHTFTCSNGASGAATPTPTTAVPATPGVQSTMQLRPVLSQSSGPCPATFKTNPPENAPVQLQGVQGQVCYSLGPSQMTIRHAKATVVTEPYSGQDAVTFELSGSDSAAFDRLAQANYHQLVAIVMFGEVMSAPEINATSFHGTGEIAGLDSATADRAASALNNGS